MIFCSISVNVMFRMETQCTAINIKSPELLYHLKRTTVEIQFKILKGGVVREDFFQKTFQELLCMDSLDLAGGHIKRGKIKTQTTKNMARLLASIIISAIQKG